MSASSPPRHGSRRCCAARSRRSWASRGVLRTAAAAQPRRRCASPSTRRWRRAIETEPSPGRGPRPSAGRRGHRRGAPQVRRPDRHRAGRLHAHQPRRRSSECRSSARRRASSIPTSPTTGARASSWPGRSTPPAASTRSSARAEAEATATGSDLETTRLDLRLEVARAYWALVTASEAVRVLEAALDTADRSLDDVRNRVEAGLLPPNDVVAQRVAAGAAGAAADRGAWPRRDQPAVDLRRLIGEDRRRADRTGRRARYAAGRQRRDPTLIAEALEPASGAGRARPRAPRASTRGSTPSPPAASPPWPSARASTTRTPIRSIFPRQAKWQDSWDISLNLSWQFWDSGRAAAERTEAQFQARVAHRAQGRGRDADARRRAEAARRAGLGARRAGAGAPGGHRGAGDQPRAERSLRGRRGHHASTCSTRRCRCCRPSSIGPGCWPTSGSTRRAWRACWGDSVTPRQPAPRAPTRAPSPEPRAPVLRRHRRAALDAVVSATSWPSTTCRSP